MITQRTARTLIEKNASYLTEITFYHIVEPDQDTAIRAVASAGEILAEQPGAIAVNVLHSTDGSRICRYDSGRTRRTCGRRTRRLRSAASTRLQPSYSRTTPYRGPIASSMPTTEVLKGSA